MPFKPSSLLHFKFENFADLPYQSAESVSSKTVKDAQGRRWELKLHPGGGKIVGISDCGGPRISLFLRYKGMDDVRATVTFIMTDREGREIIHRFSNHQYKCVKGSGKNPWIKRSKAIGMLDSEGALLIDVLVQFQPPSTCALSISDQFTSKMLALYDGGVGSDVTFKVGEHLISAHKIIVQAHSRVLCDHDCAGNEETPILIEGISGDGFAAFVRCHYGADVSASLSAAAKKDVILAADRFEAPNIKIAAEASLVRDCLMDDDNVCDWYEFAHYKTCPLLKEQAACYFILRGPMLLRSPRSDKLKQSPQLVTELMTEMSSQMNGTGVTMGVSDLRKELADKGLDLDGSKEILVSRLQSFKKRSREESHLRNTFEM